MAMGLPSSAYLPVRSFVAMFLRKQTLDEHCKHQSCDCWAYHNMLGTSNHLSLSARSPRCKAISVYLHNEHLCRLSSCKKYWTYLHVSDSTIFLGNTSPVTCFASHFCRFAIVIWTYFNFGPKVPLECVLWYDQRCAAGRLFCPYCNLESGLSLASGWNLCCAAIRFVASHLSFPSVVDWLCLIG